MFATVNKIGPAVPPLLVPRTHRVPRMERRKISVTRHAERAGRRTRLGFLVTGMKAAFDAIGTDFGGYIKPKMAFSTCARINSFLCRGRPCRNCRPKSRRSRRRHIPRQHARLLAVYRQLVQDHDILMPVPSALDKAAHLYTLVLFQQRRDVGRRRDADSV